MHRAIVNINEVPTEIISWGRWIEEGLAKNGKSDIVIVITGNPGIPAFYEKFAETINSKLPSEVPIWIIGHAGHTKLPENLPLIIPDTKSARHLYDLKGQLNHKIEFIKKYVPENAKIHFVGHSIGSWFILNLMKEDFIARRVVKCYLLFPTIERMVESPNGRFLVNIVLRVAAFLIFLSWIFSLFPEFFQIFLIKIFGLFYGIPSDCTRAVSQLVYPLSLKRVFLLAKEEMIHVKGLDECLITPIKDKLWLYYGSKDGWTPIRYYEDLKSKYPDIDAQLCHRGFIHSFVLKNAGEMGKIVGDLISENIE